MPFLNKKSARVLLDEYSSVNVKMRKGEPQGVCFQLSHILINCIANSILRHASENLHADGLTIWSAAEHTTATDYRIQEGHQ